MRKFYRRRRLAALALVLVAVVGVLVLFGTLGTQASTRVQGDYLGPDGESRAEYIERVNSMDIDPDVSTYALVTFHAELPPVAVAAALTDVPRMNAILMGSTAPIVVPEPVAGEDRAAVINRTFDRIGSSFGQRPSAVTAAVVWGRGTQLSDVASLPVVAAVEPAPVDAAWGSFAVRPPS